MVCDLSQNNLKENLENYVNALIEENLKNPKFSYTDIVNIIKEDALDENNDLSQALGIAYHVPQMIYDLIKNNPEYNEIEFVKKGYDPTKLLLEISNLKEAEDKITAIATILGIKSTSVGELEKVISGQPAEANKIYIKSEGSSELAVDNVLSHDSYNKTTDQSSKTEKIDGKVVPIINVRDPDQIFYQDMRSRILLARKDADQDFTEVEYDGHKGFRGKLMFERDIDTDDSKLRPNRGVWLTRNVSVLVVTDNNGNIMYFDPITGKITDRDKGGIPLYSALTAVNDENDFNIKNSIKGQIEDLPQAERDEILKNVDARVKKQGEELKAIKSKLKQGPILVNIIGGSIGVAVDTDTLTTENKKLAEAPLSEFDKNSFDSSSLTYVPKIIKGITDNIVGVKFKTIKGYTTLKNTKKIGEQAPDLLDNIVNVLTEDLGLTDRQKVDYVGQFINLTKKFNKENPTALPYSIGINVDKGQKLYVVLNNNSVALENKESAKEMIRNFLADNTYIHFNDKLLVAQQFTKHNIEKTETGYKIESTEELEYKPFIFTKLTPRVPLDKTSKYPVVNNGYLIFEPILTEEEVKKEVIETRAAVKEQNIPVTATEEEDSFDELKSSKLIENSATAEQNAKSENWWRNESALSKEVDENGKPLFTLNLLRNAVNSDAWATFSGSIITLYKGASFTQVYHEAWHAFSQVYLTKDQRTALYTDVSKLKGSFEVVKRIVGAGTVTFEKIKVNFKDLDVNKRPDRLLLEEFIAEEFRKYAMNDGKFKTKSEKTTVLGRLFDRIWKALKALVGKTSIYSNPGSESVLNEMFNKLYTAKDPKQLLPYSPNLKNAEFALLNSGGIVTEDAENNITISEGLLLTRTIDGILSDFVTERVQQNNEFSAATKIFSSRKALTTVYTRVKKALNDRINELLAERSRIPIEDEQSITIINNKITLLSKAVKDEVFGNINKALAGESAETSLISFHRNNSTFKDLFGKFKEIEEDSDDYEETDDKAQQELSTSFDTPINSVASEKLADEMVLYLVKSLNKQNRDGKFELNELGFKEPIEFLPFWRVLMDKASGETSVMGLYNKLEIAGNNVSPLFKQLLSKIYVQQTKGKEKVGPEESLAIMFEQGSTIGDLWMKFIQSTNLHRIDLISNTVKVVDKTGKVEIRVGKTSADYQKIVNTDWPLLFQQKEKDDFTNKINQVNYINLDTVVNRYLVKGVNTENKSTYSVTQENYIPFLNSIGLYIDNISEIKNELTPNDVNFIANAIGKTQESNDEEAKKISNIISYLAKSRVLTNGTKIDDNAFAVNRLAELQATYSTEYASSMKYTADNNLKSTYAYNNSDTQKVNGIKKSTEITDLYSDDPEFVHMNSFNPESNPAANGLIMLKSLYSTVTRKRIESNDINYRDFTGTSYTDENISDGVSIVKMGFFDKVLSTFISTLGGGYMEGVQPGDKSSNFAIKLNFINTYKGKINANLYVDTVAFITDKDGKSIMGIDPMQEVLKMLYPKLEGEIRRIAMVKADPDYYNTIKGFERGTEFDIFDEILDEETGSLKETLKSKETYDELNKVGNLSQLLTNNPLLKEKIDKEILIYFDKTEEDYNKDLFDPVFGEGVAMPNSLNELVLKDLGNKKELNNIYGKNPEDKDLNIKKAAIRSYMINNFIHKTETTVFLQGDGFQFDHTKDEMSKRAPGSQSGGTTFPVDKLTKIFIDAKVGRPYEQKLIADKVISQKEVRTYGPTLNTAIIQESEVTSVYFDMYKELFKNDLIKKKITDETQINAALYGINPITNLPGSDRVNEEGEYDDVYDGGKMKSFVNIKDGDGQGWLSFDTYRILRRAEGNWSDAQEDLFFKVVNGEDIGTSELTDMFPVYKLQYNGALATATGRIPVQAFHKFSLFPLIPSVIKNFPAANTLHKAMISQNIDYALFPSGSKRSYIKSSPSSKGDAIYNGTTDNIKPLEEIKFTKNVIYISYLKNQTSVNTYFKDQSTFSSQLRKLITSLLYKNGVPMDYIEKNNFATKEEAVEAWENETYKRTASQFHDYSEELKGSIEEFVEYKKKELLDQLGWTEDDLYAETVDEVKLQSMLKFLDKELKKQGFSAHERTVFNVSSNFDKVDLSISPLAARFEKMIMAIVNNRIVKPKLKGEPLVELSSAFMQTPKLRNATPEEIAEHDNFGGTNGLKSYIADGINNTIGFMFKRALTKMDEGLFQTDYFVKNQDGDYVNAGESIAVYKPKVKGEPREVDVEASLVRLNEMLRLDIWRNHDNNNKKLRLTGVRIPVQGHNSMEFGEVAEFLHPSAGPVIIIPAEIVAKSGTDFDVDKMTTYMPILTRNGKLMEKMTEEDIEKREEELKEKFDKLTTTKEVIESLKDQKSSKWLDINFKLNNFRKAVTTKSTVENIDPELLNNLTSNKSKVIIKTMSDPLIEQYVKDFIPKAYKIYQSKIKGVTLEDIDVVEDALSMMYDEKSELSKVYSERADLNDTKNNMLGGIQNKLMQDMINILQLPFLASSLMSPNDTNLVKPTADKIKDYQQKADNESDFTKSVKTGKKMYKKGISSTKIYTQNYNIKRHQENYSSKESLGIAAVDNYINNLLNMAGSKMKKTLKIIGKVATKKGWKDGSVDVNITLNLPHNKLNGAISLSDVMDADNNNSIADVINQLMNGFVDAGKDAWVAYLQGNTEVVPKFLFLLEAGVPIETIAYLVSNPMTRKYIKDKATGKAILSNLWANTKNPITKSYDVAEDMLKKIGFSDTVLNNLNNIYGMQVALEENSKSSDFTKETLEKVAQKSLNYTDREQVAGFLEYLYVEKLIEDYDAMKKAMNPDTKNTTTLFSAQAKIEEVRGLMDTNTLERETIDRLSTDSIISPFFIQDFARRLFNRLFKLRDDAQINNFLIGTFNNRKAIGKAKKATGYDLETYITRFKNFISQYIFTNELRNYKSGDTKYKGDTIDPVYLEQLNKDFDNGLYLDTNNDPDSYNVKNKGASINGQAFPSNVKKEDDGKGGQKITIIPNEKLRSDFIEFGLEREHLKKRISIEDVKDTKEFITRRERVKNSDKKYNQEDGETREDYLSRLNDATYENMLSNKALTNTYNIWQLFRSGDNTVAQELMDIIINYPEISDSTQYSILKQFMPKGIPNDTAYKNVLNFELKNYSNLDEGLISEYNNQWVALANKGKIKLTGKKDNDGKANAYISDFFARLPIYSFLQTGMDSSEFSLASIMPYANKIDSLMDYSLIMQKASEKFINKIETTDTDNILNGLKKLFEKENSVKKRKLRSRGSEIKVDISNLPDAENNIYEQPFIERIVGENNIPTGIFKISNTYTKDNRVYPVTKDQIDTLIKANPSVFFLLSPADLFKLKDILTDNEINKSKLSIDDIINKVISTGNDIVVFTEGFGNSPKNFYDNIGQEESKKETVSQFPIEVGRFVANNNVTYIVTQKNDNGTWQVYNPNAEGAASKKSFSEANLIPGSNKAVKVKYRDADFLVTPKDTIISLKTNTKMKWADNNGDRIAILKLKDASSVVNKPTVKSIEPIKVSGNTKVVSEPYGVVVAETAPSEVKTKDFINLIQPQIKAQAYQENKTGNKMFMYGLRWTRKSKASKPLNNKSYANKGLPITDAKATDGYVYDTVDQNGNSLAPVSDLKPIIAEIEKSLGIDMSNYDAVIGNIYLPGQRIQTHRDTTESLSARNYPVVVYTIGAGNAINVYENVNNPGSASFASDKKIAIPTKNGTIYTFGMNSKGRFELGHDTPYAIKKTDTLEPITMPNGDVIRDYTITLTFRRAADLTPGMPTTPSKTGVKTTVSTETLPGSDTKINIYAGTGENAELSNFANRPFTMQSRVGDIKNIMFNTVEGAFQAMKLAYTGEELTIEEAELIESKLQKATGAEAKSLGLKIKGLDTKLWDANSSREMKDLLLGSFKQNPDALAKLLATGNATLTHTQDKGKWGTEFPKLLMEVREELRATQPQAPVNTFKGKMTFVYGTNKREDVTANTTFDAILKGERTATTRYESEGKLDYWKTAKIGDIITWESEDGKKVDVVVTKALTPLKGSNKTAEEWSKLEGWSKEYFNRSVKPRLDEAWQIEFKLATTTQPQALDFKTMPEFTIDRKREILSNFALKHGVTKDEAYKYINEAFNNPTKNKEDVIKKLKECY